MFRLLPLLALSCLLTGAEHARWIVTLQPGVDVDQVSADIGATHGLALGHRYKHSLHGFAARGGSPARIAADPRVADVQPDLLLSLPHPFADPRPGASKKPTNPGGGKDGDNTPPPEVVPPGVQRINSHLPADFAGAVTVAVIDTGIDQGHAASGELNVIGGANFTGADSTAWQDDNDHGTHVSGTIGAVQNGVGVVGVAPGVQLYAVKVLNAQGSGWVSDIIAGLDHVAAVAASEQIVVANMSLGGGASTALDNAVQGLIDSGVVVVVAAGNDSKDAGSGSPARVTDAICVSAMADFDGAAGAEADSVFFRSGKGRWATTIEQPDDSIAFFSNYGSVVDLAAPGVLVESTVPGGYDSFSGTSMAAPHVAGVVARYAAADAALRGSLLAARVISDGIPATDPEHFSGADLNDGIAEPLVDASSADAPSANQ